jgi:xanthine dehydrogenase small subunit
VIEFMLNQELIQWDATVSDLTLLQWLREERQLTGSKEGCAAGDCGACTVLVGQVEEGQLKYRSINACICFMGSLAGHHVLTVESLQQDGNLHPVQQALVDNHGSQCGFCTPGFVMSLLGWWWNTEPQQLDSEVNFANHRHEVEQALSGNLCRCTGYQPILLAADSLAPRSRADDLLLVDKEKLIARLTAINNSNAQPTTSTWQGFYSPTNVADLSLAYTACPEARLVAGATDLSLELTQKLQPLPSLINLKQITELNQLQQQERHLVIGAAVSLLQMESVLRPYYPAFADILTWLGSRQIRHQGTMAGNIASASPIADTPPALLALDSQVVLQRGSQQRTIALSDFYLGYRQTVLRPAEFIHSILIPLPVVRQQFFMAKVSKRKEDDISAVCLALSIVLQSGVVKQAAIGAGGLAATPARARTTESLLQGQTLDHNLINACSNTLAKDFQPISDFRASAAYRRQVTQNLLQDFLQKALSHDALTQEGAA